MPEVGRVLVRYLETLILLCFGTGATKLHILLITLLITNAVLFDHIEHVQVLQRLSAYE